VTPTSVGGAPLLGKCRLAEIDRNVRNNLKKENKNGPQTKKGLQAITHNPLILLW